MFIPDIQSKEHITEQQLIYLASLAETIAVQDDFSIKNFADSLITSPDVQNILQSKDSTKFLDYEPPINVAFDIFNPSGSSIEMMALSTFQENVVYLDFWPKIRTLFGNLRRKVKRIFCKVVLMLNSDDELDLKAIIKQVLIALIPALAASSGLMPVALPIVISLAAMLLKYGVNKVCPV